MRLLGRRVRLKETSDSLPTTRRFLHTLYVGGRRRRFVSARRRLSSRRRRRAAAVGVVGLRGRSTRSAWRSHVGRIDSAAMAAILVDIDGVLHVSGEPIPGAIEAVTELRRQGHRLRFVTNNTTRPRATLAEELRGSGLELDDAELQTTAVAAASALAGKRVLALVIAALVEEL